MKTVNHIKYAHKQLKYASETLFFGLKLNKLYLIEMLRILISLAL